jgi:hypothetical protein
MHARRFIPRIILALLTLLAAGAIAVGLHDSTPSVNSTMANATAATYGAPLGVHSFSLDLTNSVSSGNGTGFISQVRRIDYSPTDGLTVFQTSPSTKVLGVLTAHNAQGVLASYAADTAGDAAWTQNGTRFTRTESLTSFSRRVHQQSSPHGTMYEHATVRDGVLVSLSLRAVFPRQRLASGKIAAAEIEGETFTLLKINGRTAP